MGRKIYESVNRKAISIAIQKKFNFIKQNLQKQAHYVSGN